MITSKLFINKYEKRAKLLSKWLLKTYTLLNKMTLVRKLRLGDKPQKNLILAKLILLEPISIRIIKNIIKEDKT